MAKSHRNFLWLNRNLSWSTFFVMGPIFDIGAGYILSGVLDQVVLSCMLMFLGCQIESRETLARLRRVDNCCAWATIKTNKQTKNTSRAQNIGQLLHLSNHKNKQKHKHQPGSENLENCCAWATIKTTKKHQPGSEDRTIAALRQP